MIARIFICRVNYYLIYTHLYHIYFHVWLRYDFQIPARERIVTIRSSKRHCRRSTQLFGQLYRRENIMKFHMHHQVISGVTFISTPTTRDYVEMILFVDVYTNFTFNKCITCSCGIWSLLETGPYPIGHLGARSYIFVLSMKQKKKLMNVTCNKFSHTLTFMLPLSKNHKKL